MKGVEFKLILCLRTFSITRLRTVATRVIVRLSILGALLGHRNRRAVVLVHEHKLIVTATGFSQGLSLDISLLVDLSLGCRLPERLLLDLLV